MVHLMLIRSFSRVRLHCSFFSTYSRSNDLQIVSYSAHRPIEQLIKNSDDRNDDNDLFCSFTFLFLSLFPLRSIDKVKKAVQFLPSKNPLLFSAVLSSRTQRPCYSYDKKLWVFSFVLEYIDHRQVTDGPFFSHPSAKLLFILPNLQ